VSDEFKIDKTKISEIAKEFPVVTESQVEELHKAYCDFSPYLQGQYLAHVMRAVECYFRRKMKNERFIVICEPYKEFAPDQKQASAYYYQCRSAVRSNDKTNSSFIINYNDKLTDEKELRDYIAHEIGHLFLEAAADIITGQDIGGRTEPLSTIFGIFTMSEKNDFYANFNKSARNHKDWQELFDYFIKIHKN